MGNRAVITPSVDPDAPAIYLHWNGGRASVEAFLAAARHLSIRGNDAKAMDALAETIARRFFRHKVGSTVYRAAFCKTDADNGDNGVYVVNQDLNIIDRLHVCDCEEINAEKTKDIFDQMVACGTLVNGGAA